MAKKKPQQQNDQATGQRIAELHAALDAALNSKEMQQVLHTWTSSMPSGVAQHPHQPRRKQHHQSGNKNR